MLRFSNRTVNIAVEDRCLDHQQPRAALQTTPTDFFAVQTRSRNDVGMADELTGDLTMSKVKWFFNVTRGTLIEMKVIGRYPTLTSAIDATRAL